VLERYIKKFLTLRTDKNRNKWSGITKHQAPHKPLLLLSVMDLFAQGQITENFIEPSFELVETFNAYWAGIMPLGSKGNMAYPFPRLHNDEIWRLIKAPGFKGSINIQSISSMVKLRAVCSGAKLDNQLFKLMSQSETREHLRTVLINSYFAEEIRARVLECGHVNIKAYEYSKELLKGAKDIEKPWDKIEPDVQAKKVRDQGFRKAIITLYEHRCALCGIRMLTPEGHTIVEAAHVIPWSESRDDSPANGMALCRLCHWSFDEGLMSVGAKYEVLVSKSVSLNRNYPGHILTLSDRNIIKPEKIDFWPDQKNLEWHRGKVFCRQGFFQGLRSSPAGFENRHSG